MFDLILSNNADALVAKPKAHCSTFNVGAGYFVCICHDVYVGITIEA